ncbi:MAG: glycosyltransferase family 2 protein [Acidobacteria bacterium]|nr:glycosyltransferase family 2 protein [Acidobacteriota bacterium]
MYEHYTGENPVLDTLYDLRLRRQDLEALDRACARNPRRTDLIVTLTTLPSRIERIDLTLKSLLRQRVAPAAIRLHVPRESRREGVAYVVPERLSRLRSLTIVRTDDYGPATKVIPALLACARDQRLLVVDDDRVFHPTFIEQMAAWSDQHPDAAVAGSGWDAPADLIDRPTTLWATLAGLAPAPIKCTRVRGCRDVDIVQGMSGYVVRPRDFDVSAIVDYSRAPEAAFFVDDVWISAHCRARKLVCRGRRVCFPSRRDARFYKRSSVSLVNRGTGAPASRNNTIMLKFFADRWRSSR